MPEAHKLYFPGLDALDERSNVLHRTDFHQHAENFFVRPAMERPVKRRDGRGRCGVGVDVRTAHAANRVGRTVLPTRFAAWAVRTSTPTPQRPRSEEHTSELQSRGHLVGGL